MIKLGSVRATLASVSPAGSKVQVMLDCDLSHGSLIFETWVAGKHQPIVCNGWFWSNQSVATVTTPSALFAWCNDACFGTSSMGQPYLSRHLHTICIIEGHKDVETPCSVCNTCIGRTLFVGPWTQCGPRNRATYSADVTYSSEPGMQ